MLCIHTYLCLGFFFKHIIDTMIATMVINPAPPTTTPTVIPVNESDLSEMKNMQWF